MTGNRRNGNINKGNKQKKSRRRVQQYADYVKGDGDQYAKVHKLTGGEHLEVELIEPDESNDKIVMCRIPGKFFKKIWFRAGDLVVLSGKFSDTIYDLKGRVQESDVNSVQKLFDRTKVEATGIRIGADDDDDLDYDAIALGIKTTKVKNSDSEYDSDSDVDSDSDSDADSYLNSDKNNSKIISTSKIWDIAPNQNKSKIDKSENDALDDLDDL